MSADKPTHKMVNGELVELTPEEVAEIEAEWAANEADSEPEPPPATKQEKPHARRGARR